jgi:hypothetical protein
MRSGHEAGSASELATRLRTVGHALALASVDGPPRGSAALVELEALVPSLRRVTPESLPTDAERIAFFVNLYNVLVLHGAVVLGVERSVLEEPSFFGAVAYRVGPAVLTPDRIEHGVLRRGARHFGRPSLADDDPARAFLPSSLDPRVHAALVCASASCPPIAFYVPERLDAQLEVAARHFVATHVRVVGRTLWLPAMFRHYAADFGDPAREARGLRRGVREFLEAHSEPELRVAMERADRVRHAAWDWRFSVRVVGSSSS